MSTQTAMTTEEIQAKISEFVGKRAELEKTLATLSKQSASAMVTGESTTKLDAQRHETAEEVRHLGEIIAGLEQSLRDAAKNADIQTLEKHLRIRKETKPRFEAARMRLASAQAELKAAEAEVKQLEEAWYGSGRIIGAYQDKLKKTHGLMDIEINQIEAKFKL